LIVSISTTSADFVDSSRVGITIFKESGSVVGVGAGLKRQINFELCKLSFLPLIVSISAATTDFIDSGGVVVAINLKKAAASLGWGEG
jgi:hypothetical protein